MIDHKLLSQARKRRARKESGVIKLKTTEQIDGIRRSCQLAARTLAHLDEYIFDGVTTEEIDRRAEEFMRDHGAIPAPLGYKGPSGIPYPKATCISVNEVVCHGIPGPYVLKGGDIVNVDITTILDGYYGDTSRMFAICSPDTSPSDEAIRLMKVAFDSLWVGIEQVRPGNRVGNIGYEIARYAEPQGYSIVHAFCGHGVGLEFHEEPQINHKAAKDTGPVMKPGMIFTIEPMLNLGSPNVVILEDRWTVSTEDRKLSAQNEHTVLVTEIGYEVLTQTPD